MMRKMLVVLCTAVTFFSVLAPVSAEAKISGKLEFLFQPNDSAARPSGNLFLAYSFEKYGLGVSAFALVTKGWGELYVGPTWAPTDWIQLSLSLGLEASADRVEPRFAASVWTGYKGFSFLVITEFNSRSFQGDYSTVWFDITAKYQPAKAKWFAVGLKYRRPIGTGFLVEFSTPTAPSVAVWCAWMPIDPERADGDLVHLKRFLLAVQLRF